MVLVVQGVLGTAHERQVAPLAKAWARDSPMPRDAPVIGTRVAQLERAVSMVMVTSSGRDESTIRSVEANTIGQIA